MKGKIRWISGSIGLSLILIGLGVGLYPTVSSYFTEYRAKKEILDYQEAVKAQNPDTIISQRNMAENYNKELAGESGVSVVSYNDLLAVTDSLGYLEIPKLELYLPIYHGTDEDVLEKGVGHMKGTSLPVGGSSTHCVLSGHTGLPAAKLFTHLDELNEGDMFYIHVLNETLAYQVDKKSVVLPTETDEIQIEEGKDYVTLLTCIPYGVNSHRLLVRGERTAYKPESISVKTQEKEKVKEHMPSYIAVASVIVIFIMLLAVIIRKRKSNKH